MSKAKLLVGTWTHIFNEDDGDTTCRIVIDQVSEKVLFAQALVGNEYITLGRNRLADLEESVIEVNGAHEKPSEWGLVGCKTVPEWATL